MSGAEAFLALGVAANILQFVEFSTELCTRIRDYSNNPGVPKKLARQTDQLDHLLQILHNVCKISHEESLERQIVASCQAQAKELYYLLESLKGSIDGDRWWKNAKKALKSMSRAEKIKELQTTLDSLMSTLGLQLQATMRDHNLNVEATTKSILERQDEHSKTLDEIRQLARMKLDTEQESSIVDQPIWLVSIGRNHEFVGRSSIIEDLQERLKFDPYAVQQAVLCGLGGVGKSQIALEYAYRERDGPNTISVFWVHATNPAQFIESFKRIASELMVPGVESPEIDILQLVHDYIESKYKCRWLMIVDNVDDRVMFFEDQNDRGKCLCEYIPRTSNGVILYTTRNRDIGVDLDSHRDPIEVPSMNVEDALSLLGVKIRSQSTKEEQIELLEELVYLPLAITQAVAFMIKRRKTIRQYLESYKQSDSTRIRLLGQRFMPNGRESRTLESVTTTWWVSFNYIKSENARAAGLLSIMSVLDRQGIPDSLLLKDDEDSFDFDEAIGLLESFSLITRSPSGKSSSMHRLVQVATRAWLQEYEGSAEDVAEEALSLLASRYPEGIYENWTICATYLPHADAVLRYNFIERTENLEAAKAQLLAYCSSYLRRQGNFGPAELRSAESWKIREKLYGIEHKDTLWTIAEYAMVIHKRGKYEEAIRLQRLVLAGREKVLGPNDRLTLESLNALGYDLRSVGKFKEAEEIHRRELTQKQKLLDENPDDWGLQADLLVALNNTARLLSHEGRHAEAEQMHRDSLMKTIELMGPDHPDTLITLGELASDLREQDKLEQSQKTFEALLEKRMRVLGPLHPDTLLTKSNLATLRGRQGRTEEAVDMYRRVYQEELQVLGAKHPSTLNSLHNLAWMYANQGRSKEAAETFEQVLCIQEDVLGRRHPDCFSTRMNLCISLRNDGRHEETDQVAYELIDMALGQQDDYDLGYMRRLSRLATILVDQERYPEAEKISRQELELRESVKGSESHDPNYDAYGCRQTLALALSQQCKFNEAILLNKEVLDYRTKALGRQHPQTFSILWNLGMCYRDAKLHEEAEQTFTDLLNLEVEELGRDDPDVLETLVQVAWLQQQLTRYTESEASYRWLLEAQTQVGGPEAPFTLMITNNLASVLQYQNRNEEAKQLYRKAYELRLKVLGAEDLRTRKSLRNLVEILQELGKHEEATPLLELLNKEVETPTGSDGGPSDWKSVAEVK